MRHEQLLTHLKELRLPAFDGKTDAEILSIATTGELPKSVEATTSKQLFSDSKTLLLVALTNTKRTLENTFFVSGGFCWQCDRDSRIRLYGIASIREADFPADRSWRTADNVDVPITYAYVHGLLADLETYTNALFQASQTHKQAIEALTTQEEVNAYDVLAGWPANTL